jgi:hypothetical protein
MVKEQRSAAKGELKGEVFDKPLANQRLSQRTASFSFNRCHGAIAGLPGPNQPEKIEVWIYV